MTENCKVNDCHKRELVAALEEIVGLTVALRSGGPDPMDLNGLSEALEHATNLAHDALILVKGDVA